ncbi:MAG: LysM peptidoglycan-binding domain-containing protein [Devosia sp.]
MVLEDKLADSAPQQPAPKPTAPRQPLALALGAAATTVVIILGVLAGPSVVNCFNAADGMGQCLQASMRDAGLLPAATSAPIEATITPAAPAQPAASSDSAVVAPGPDAVPLNAAAVAANAAAEAPDDLIAATFGLLRAEPDGSVVIAGSGTPGSEIEVYSNGALLGKTKVEASGDWVLVPDVRIAPGGTEITLGEVGKAGLAPQSFVVAINEDKTSEPLVVASTPGASSKVLQGLPSASPATTTQLATADSTAPLAAAKSGVAAAVVAPTVAAAPAAATDASLATASPAAAPDTSAIASAPATPLAPPATASTPAEPAAPADNDVASATSPVATPAEPAMTVATAEPAPAVAAPAAAPAAPVERSVTAAAPTIDAVEVDGDKTFFAGSGVEGATVRLYVDDAYIADSLVADGRWLIEAGKVLTKPDQRVRVDMLAAGGAEVMSRAEVDFHIDLPASATPAVTTTVAAAPASAPDAAAPVPSMVAVSLGGSDDQRFGAGKAIIRRGDNLWTIARRVYGEGIKYTTIYQANNGQIRDPDRIYPGQVFDLPHNAVN